MAVSKKNNKKIEKKESKLGVVFEDNQSVHSKVSKGGSVGSKNDSRIPLAKVNTNKSIDFFSQTKPKSKLNKSKISEQNEEEDLKSKSSRISRVSKSSKVCSVEKLNGHFEDPILQISVIF